MHIRDEIRKAELFLLIQMFVFEVHLHAYTYHIGN